MIPSSTSLVAQTRDPFEPYDNASNGKAKGHPVVPEPLMAGLFLISLCLGVWLARRWWAARGGQTCCGGSCGGHRHD